LLSFWLNNQGVTQVHAVMETTGCYGEQTRTDILWSVSSNRVEAEVGVAFFPPKPVASRPAINHTCIEHLECFKDLDVRIER
jgi:hypothetical protein